MVLLMSRYRANALARSKQKCMRQDSLGTYDLHEMRIAPSSGEGIVGHALAQPEGLGQGITAHCSEKAALTPASTPDFIDR